MHKNEALSILNLQNSTTNAQGSDTALGKIIDREELFSFILSISNQEFELFENSNRAIIQMMNGKDAALPEISYPKNFSIRNENDITQEIANAKAAGAPDIAIRALLIEYMNIRFNTDSQTTKLTDIVFAADRLITLTSIEISNKILSGTVAKWEDVLHVSIYGFLSELVQTDDRFLNLSLEDQVKILHDMAKEKLEEISPTTTSTNDILNQSANAGAPAAGLDIAAENAKAQAALRGSVGGVQGILAIQAAVSAGTSDYEAAVATLEEIYGYEEKRARRLLGNPINLKPTNKLVA